MGEDNKKLVSGYSILFDIPDSRNNIITKESINIDSLVQLKLNGEILDYEIDDKGVKVIKKVNIKSYDIGL